MTKSKITKPSKAQVDHIRNPFVDKSGGKAKKPKIYNTVEDTEAKFSGNATGKGIKLKKGKK